MDCLSILDSIEYDCTNRWGVNCTNALGFEFTSLWNITQHIQKYCPTDPRLFLANNIPATPENAALTQEACKVFAPSPFTVYPTSDIWGRLQTWKFPLLQLIASSPRPPLGLWVEGFVIVHLMGDPIGTIKDLLRKLSLCEERAAQFATYFAEHPGSLTEAECQGAWKAMAMITISYDEFGEGIATKNTLQNTLHELSPVGGEPLDKFLRLCHKNSDALAADRATAFLPIIVAQGFFVGAIAVAIAKTSAITSTSSIFVNVEAHSIAFSALYFWIVPAVYLSSVIGVSQTQNNLPRILEGLQTAFSHEPSLKHIILPKLGGSEVRITNGGIYSWQPKPQDEDDHQGFVPLLKRNGLPILTVVSGTVTAMLISGFVPADGWQPRHCAHATFLLAWIISFSATSAIKRYTSNHQTKSLNFWLTFAKDTVAALATLCGMMYIQVGPFNRCSSYSLWGRKGLQLPGMPEVEAVLNYRIRTWYPAIAFTSIGLHLVVIPIFVLARYRRALQVLLQSDEETSIWPRWLRLPKRRHGVVHTDSQSQGLLSSSHGNGAGKTSPGVVEEIELQRRDATGDIADDEDEWVGEVESSLDRIRRESSEPV